MTGNFSKQPIEKKIDIYNLHFYNSYFGFRKPTGKNFYTIYLDKEYPSVFVLNENLSRPVFMHDRKFYLSESLLLQMKLKKT